MERSIAFWNSKGGSGKTTGAVNLAAALALASRRVLLVDLCIQGDASSDLRFAPEDGLDPFVGTEPIPVPGYPLLRALPADPELLASCESSGEVPRLSLDLGRGETLIIDCPPSVGPLSASAILAARTLIVPVVPDIKSVNKLPVVDSVLQQLAGHLPPRHSTWVLLNQFDVRRNLDRSIYYELAGSGRQLFSTLIPFNVALREAAPFGPVFSYRPLSSGADSYRALVKEVVRRGIA